MGGEEFKWRQPAHQLWSQQGPHFSLQCAAKTNDKRMVSSGISNVVASIHSEKTSLKKVMIMIIKLRSESDGRLQI